MCNVHFFATSLKRNACPLRGQCILQQLRYHRVRPLCWILTFCAVVQQTRSFTELEPPWVLPQPGAARRRKYRHHHHRSDAVNEPECQNEANQTNEGANPSKNVFITFAVFSHLHVSHLLMSLLAI